MKLFLSYLSQRKLGIGLFALFAVIELVVFALYRLPVAAVLYALALCLAAGILVLVWDFLKVTRTHRRLAAIRSAADAVTASLPAPETIPEADYQELIGLLCREQREMTGRLNLRYQDMIEYYTTWAHQIKTPIAAMRLKLQNEDSSLSRQLSADLTRIEQYVEMVLMFLRLDSDSMDYVIKEQALDPIVRQAVRKFAGEFISRKLKLVYEPLDASVVTDEKWLAFVVEQVLSNALKYTPSGSVRVYLEAPKTLCVQDTGIGIDPGDLPRIFEKGYTGCNGRGDKRATGIGLYLCRRICCRLGHSITAESVPNQGTTVRIDLNQDKLEVE